MVPKAMNYQFSNDEKLDREAAGAELRHFLDRVLAGASLDLRYAIESLDPAPGDVEQVELRVAFSGQDEEFLLEHNGELLQALEYLAVRWLRLDPHLYDRIRLDAANYRADRIEELKLSARVAAQRVAETGQSFRFNPMPARERRILHMVLSEIPAVRSESEGYGEDRQVVIHPAKPLRSR
jgi:spoIIIJ-associated protein